MHKTMGTKEGGRHVEMSPSEEKTVRDEWARNEARQVVENARHAIMERIPSAQEIAMLQLKAQYGITQAERNNAEAELRAALAAQKELDAFE